LALLFGAAASAGSTWLSEGRSVNERAVIAFGFGLIGAGAAAGVWYVVLLVCAPYRQRDAARKELEDKVDYEELDAAITERLARGAELKASVEHMAMGEWERVRESEFEAWDAGNIELLERLVPAFVADYKFAEVPAELYDSYRWGEETRKRLLPAGKVEAKLRSLRAIREQVRADR
jgi:hypothetical protein